MKYMLGYVCIVLAGIFIGTIGLFIKLADRLQNRLTFNVYNQEQQNRIYKETKTLLPLAKKVNLQLYNALKSVMDENKI